MRQLLMPDYGPATYGDGMAAVYDDWLGVPRDTDAAVPVLAELAGRGPVLELGIGTGRVALPLGQRGIKVHGIDASQAMVTRMRAKPGGKEIPVVVGDFADVGIEGAFSLIYVVFNTFFALPTQEEQVRCMEGVARRLTEGGVFLIQAFVPDLTLYEHGQRVSATQVDVQRVTIDVARLDPVTQRVAAQHIVLEDGGGVRLYPVQLRYAWPSELDLMARCAGLRLRERWGGWGREPFTAESKGHISLFERAGPGG